MHQENQFEEHGVVGRRVKHGNQRNNKNTFRANHNHNDKKPIIENIRYSNIDLIMTLIQEHILTGKRFASYFQQQHLALYYYSNYKTTNQPSVVIKLDIASTFLNNFDILLLIHRVLSLRYWTRQPLSSHVQLLPGSCRFARTYVKDHLIIT